MKPDRPMGPQHPKESISAYLDDRLGPEDRARVGEHLRTCSACRLLLDDFRMLAEAARREEVPPVPGDLAARIGRRIDAEPAARDARWRRLITGAPLPLATAAAAVIVFASLWIVLRGRLPLERSEAPPPEGPSPEAGLEAPPPAPPLQQAPPAQAPPAPTSETAPRNEQAPLFRSVEPEPQTAPEPVVGSATAEPAPPAAPSPEHVPPAPSSGQAPPVRGPVAAAPRERRDAAADESAPAAKDPTVAERANEMKESDAMLQGLAPQGSVMPMVDASTDQTISGPTLVFAPPDARVALLPDSRIVLASGDYRCTLRAAGPEGADAVRELRMAAARLPPPPAGAGAPVGGVAGEVIIPLPPAGDPGSADLRAQMRRSLRTLLASGLLARAEAQCGPAPPALRGIAAAEP